MPDEVKLGIAQHKGARAQELLDSSFLTEAFAEIEAGYLAEWRSCTAADLEAREAAWRAIKTLDGIKSLLKLYVSNGRIASADLRRLSEASQARISHFAKEVK